MNKQLLLPTIPEPEIKIKKIPRKGTVPGDLCEMLITGRWVTHPMLQKEDGSWRAAAAVYLLRSWGYPVQTQEIRHSNKVTSKNQVIAAYYFEHDFIQKYKRILQGDVSYGAKR